MEPSRSLTRKEFDEVIRRAAEIAASEPESGDAALTESDLFRIAREVGLDERFVRKALVEVRTAPPPTSGFLSGLYGPLSVTVARVVPGSRDSLSKTLDEFMVAGRLLQNVRRGPGLLQYRPAVDWASQIARAASSTSRQYYVASAKRVEVRLESVDEFRTLVEISVEPGTRDDHLAGGIIGGISGGAAVGGGVGVGLALVLAAPAALAVVVGVAAGSAVFGGIGWGVGRRHKRRLLEVRSEMEGILDRLESGESLEPPPPSWRRWVQRHFHGVAKDLMGEGDEPRRRG